MPNRASRHHFIRASNWARVSCLLTLSAGRSAPNRPAAVTRINAAAGNRALVGNCMVAPFRRVRETHQLPAVMVRFTHPAYLPSEPRGSSPRSALARCSENVNVLLREGDAFESPFVESQLDFLQQIAADGPVVGTADPGSDDEVHAAGSQLVDGDHRFRVGQDALVGGDQAFQ